MEIKGFIESSLLEWEGKIASVVFLPGCNLRCRYCHAGHLVFHPDRLESIPRHRVMAYLARQSNWVDGLVVSGGEPTLHASGLPELLEEARSHGLQTMIHTNGTQPDVLGRLLERDLLDALSMDVKAPLTPDDYRRVVNAPVDVDAVRRSIELVRDSDTDYEFRVTLVPGLVGAQELRRLAPELKGARRIALQNFQPDHCLDRDLRVVAPFGAEQLDEFERMVEPYAERIVVRGRDHAVRARSQAG